MKNRNALVTGAAGGLGAAITGALRAAGVRVAAADRDLDGIEAEVLLPGDLTDRDYCDGLPDVAARALGGLDILINNAGLIRRGRIDTVTDEDYRFSFAVNVEAPFRLCRAAVPLLSRNESSAIVNVASCWGLRPGSDHPVYCMTKAAVAAMTQCLGRDHAPQGIRVNAVCPNEMDTPMLRSGFEARGLDPARAIGDLNASVPLGHIADPAEIAEVVVFLCSEGARYLCGALIEAHGGKPVQ